jgi:ribosomal protein L23
MNKSTDFEVSNDATKAQIAKAFKSMLKAKTTNKKILSSFVDMVA